MFDLSAIKKPRSFGDAAFFGKQKSRGFTGPAALVFKGFLKTPSSSPPRYDDYNYAARYNEFVFHKFVSSAMFLEKCRHRTKIIAPCQAVFSSGGPVCFGIYVVVVRNGCAVIGLCASS
jgi:hypothetical protein